MSCIECSIKNGFTIWRNTSMTYFSDEKDEYANHTCGLNEQCVEQQIETYLEPKTFGCCETCGPNQLCYEGSIARASKYLVSNL